MSIEIAWLEQFTGMPLAEIPPEPEGQKGGKKSETPQEAYFKAQANEAAYEKKRQQQALLLAQVRADLGPIKSKSRALLSTRIQAGPLKGKSFLKVEGGCEEFWEFSRSFSSRRSIRASKRVTWRS